MEVSGQLYTPASLLPEKDPCSTYQRGRGVDPRAGSSEEKKTLSLPDNRTAIPQQFIRRAGAMLTDYTHVDIPVRLVSYRLAIKILYALLVLLILATVLAAHSSPFSRDIKESNVLCYACTLLVMICLKYLYLFKHRECLMQKTRAPTLMPINIIFI